MTLTATLTRYAAIPVITGAIALGVTGCDTAPPTVNASRQVTVVGSAPIQGTPGTLVTTAVTTSTSGDATTAINQTTERQQIIINALVDAGVKRHDITTVHATLRPVSSPRDGGIVAYQASSVLRVRVECDSAAQVGTVIAHTGGDITQITDVSYGIDTNSPLVHNAREQAFNDAHTHAEQYASLAGGQLGKVLSLSETMTGFDNPVVLDPPARLPEQSPATIGTVIQTTIPQAPVVVDQKKPALNVLVTAVWELR